MGLGEVGDGGTATRRGGGRPSRLGSPGRIRARSPVLAWAKRAGIDRLTALQQAYISICETQVMPPVNPDLTVLESLTKRRVEANLDACGRDSLKALARFLESEDAVNRLVGVALKAGGEAVHKGPRLARNADAASAEKGAAMMHKVFAALGKLIGHAETLHELRLSGLSLSSADLKAIAAGLSKNSKVGVVSFGGCAIGDIGLREVAPALAASHVNLLDLSSTGITSASALHVARIIKAHGGRRDEAVWSASLRMQSTGGGSSSFVTQGLCLLDVSGNAWDADGLQVICEALEADSWILGVNLSPSRQSASPDRPLAAVAQCVAQNPSLVALVLRPPATLADQQKDKAELSLIAAINTRPVPLLPLLPCVAAQLRCWREQGDALLQRAASCCLVLPSQPSGGAPVATQQGKEQLQKEEEEEGKGRGGSPGTTPPRREASSSKLQHQRAPAAAAGSSSLQAAEAGRAEKRGGRLKESSGQQRQQVVPRSSSGSRATPRRPPDDGVDPPPLRSRRVTADALAANTPPPPPPLQGDQDSPAVRRRGSNGDSKPGTRSAAGATAVLPPPAPAREERHMPAQAERQLSSRSKASELAAVSKRAGPPTAAVVASSGGKQRGLPLSRAAGGAGGTPPRATTKAAIKKKRPAQQPEGGGGGGESPTTALIDQLVCRMGLMTEQVEGLETTVASWAKQREEQLLLQEEDGEEEEALVLVDDSREALIREVSRQVHRRLQQLWDL